MNKTINKQEALRRLANLEKKAQALREIIEKPEVGSILSKETGKFCIDGSTGGFAIADLYYKPFGNNHFSTTKEVKDWAQAIDTLIALRRQEGSCKPVDGKRQYIVCVNNEMGFFTGSWKACSYKIPYISPCFISEEYALQAITNIGEEKLMHMFKTFHGITE